LFDHIGVGSLIFTLYSLSNYIYKTLLDT